jgi:hypothetical protein
VRPSADSVFSLVPTFTPFRLKTVSSMLPLRVGMMCVRA